MLPLCRYKQKSVHKIFLIAQTFPAVSPKVKCREVKQTISLGVCCLFY